jgi:glycosyltransferase involved in cell wall biosynthesis
MKILYIHQYFNTYAEGGSSRSYYLSKALVDSGHTVEVITSHNSKIYKRSVVEGITVHYLPVYYDNRLGFGGRVSAFIKFIIKAYKLAATIKQVDLCYATSTPLTVGIIACMLKKWHRIPFYFEVRDLWPQAPIEMGVIRNAFIKKGLYALESFLYRHAAKIIALSPGIKEAIIAKTGNASKVYLIPNMADCDFFDTEENVALTATPDGRRHKLTIAYFGAVGPVNHLNSFIEVARFFQEKKIKNVQFLIIGKGNQWEHIKNLALQYELSNTLFVPHASKYELRRILAGVDAVYISFAQLPVLETSSPNKFFDSLAAGKLCIVNTKGWIKECIEEAACGFYAEPDKPEQVYKKLLPYMASKRKLAEAKTAARLLAETQFDRELLTSYFITLFPQQYVNVPYAAETVVLDEDNA